jgi:signal transduction histidine kinase
MTETTRYTIKDFCWAVIFELRQPMTAISGHAQRARHLIQTDPRRACEALDDVVEQIARIDGLLLELYERERQTAGTPELEKAGGRRPVREGVKT